MELETVSERGLERRSKRGREEEEDGLLPDYLQSSKELKRSQDLNMMADTMAGIASMTIRGMNVIVKGLDIEDDSSCPGHVVLQEGARMPRKGSRNAAGYDVYSNAQVRIEKGKTGAVPLGFSFKPMPGTYGQLEETSSWAITHPDFQLRAGVLDPEYNGELFALFTYTGKNNFGYVEKGVRVAQLVGVCFRAHPFQRMGRLPTTGRGEQAGFKNMVEEDPDVDIGPTARYHLPTGTLSWGVGRGNGEVSQGIQTDSGVDTMGTRASTMEKTEASDGPAL
jgi:dUTP pyrophosphatase